MIEMTNNKLKIIAIITMIIDHIGFYFSASLNPYIYVIFRCIGRIAMPIFTFLIVEGYCYTKNFKKYIIRLGILAIITQLGFIICDYMAKNVSNNLASIFNIVFSFILMLIFLRLFDNYKEKKDFLSKVILVMYILTMIIIYKFVKIDYGFIILILGIGMFFIKRYVKNLLMQKIFLGIWIFCNSIFLAYFNNIYFLFIILSLVPLILYNNKLGKKSKIIKHLFYIIFPLQHFVLYGIYIYIKLK